MNIEYDLFDLLNIYLCYYKQTNFKDASFNMFEDIDLENPKDTNHCLESFYDEVFRFKEQPNATDPCPLEVIL